MEKTLIFLALDQIQKIVKGTKVLYPKPQRGGILLEQRKWS